MSVVSIWVHDEVTAHFLENQVFKKEICDAIRAQTGLFISVGIGTFLREGDVQIDGEGVDEKVLQFFHTLMISHGYRIFTSRPSIDKMVAEMLIHWNRMSKEGRDEIGLLEVESEEELYHYHHTLGQNIRNDFKLWQCTWYPEIVNGVDISPEHPDSVSMRVIRELWWKLRNIEDEWNA